MDWLIPYLEHLTYPVIAFLMMLESTVIPLPSEVVLAPAAYHAAAGEQNIFLVVLAATAGALVGSSINYLLARILGRPLLYAFADSRAGRLCLLSKEKLQKAEDYFNEHGMVATITGRLIIGIRHLISLPAGLARMNYLRFLLYTTIGTLIWHTILAALGWYLHYIVPEEQLAGAIAEYSTYIKLTLVLLLAAVFLFFACRYFLRRRQHKG